MPVPYFCPLTLRWCDVLPVRRTKRGDFLTCEFWESESSRKNRLDSLLPVFLVLVRTPPQAANLQALTASAGGCVHGLPNSASFVYLLPAHAMELPPAGASPLFATTRWSVLLAAKSQNSPEAAAALEQLCQTYWYPVYAQVRRRGHSPEESEDLTQAFFASLLEREWFALAQRNRGRFRSFLLSSLNFFLGNEWDHKRAQKRGGHVQILSLDTPDGEARLAQEPVAHHDPEQEFDRRWAMALLETVMSRLEREYRAAGKSGVFATLKGAVDGDSASLTGAEAANALAMSEGAVRVAAHRLRQRYRELLREEIRQTVATDEEVEIELRHLFASFSAQK